MTFATHVLLLLLFCLSGVLVFLIMGNRGHLDIGRITSFQQKNAGLDSGSKIPDAAQQPFSFVSCSVIQGRILANVESNAKRVGFEHVNSKKSVARDKSCDFKTAKRYRRMAWNFFWGFGTHPATIKNLLQDMKQGQKLNAVPGIEATLGNKSYLTRLNQSYIPRGFTIPEELEQLELYIARNPDKVFIHKGFRHHALSVISDTAAMVAEFRDILESNGTKRFGANEPDEVLVQEMVHPPMLIDKKKFDMTFFVVVTSVDPLRYYASEDILLRFCRANYYPLDTRIRDKILVEDFIYYGINNSTSLRDFHKRQYSHRRSLSIYLKSKGQDIDTLLNQFKSILNDVIQRAYPEMLQELDKVPKKNRRAVFQLLRPDFMAGEDMKVHLIEINSFPNTAYTKKSWNHFQLQRDLYFVMHLAGLLEGGKPSSLLGPPVNRITAEWLQRGLIAFPEECQSGQCQLPGNCLSRTFCSLCPPCLSQDDIKVLEMAVHEQRNRFTFGRMYPEPPGSQAQAARCLETRECLPDGGNLTWMDYKMHLWYLGKCLQDEDWCH